MVFAGYGVEAQQDQPERRATAARTRLLAADGVRTSGGDRLGRLAAGVPGPGHRDGEGHARRAAARRPPRARPRRSRRGIQRGRVPRPRAQRAQVTRRPRWRRHPRGRDRVLAPSGEAGLDTDALPSDAAVRAAIEHDLTSDGLPAAAGRLTATAPALAARTDLRNPRRVVRALEIAMLRGDAPLPEPLGYAAPVLGLQLALEPAEHRERIAARARAQFDAGLIDEARALRERSTRASTPSRRSGTARAGR